MAGRASSPRGAKSARLDFFRKLVAMKPDIRRGHVLLSELVAAGEVPVSLTNYASNADSMKRGTEADRLESGRAGGRQAAGARPGGERAAPARGAAVRGFRAVPGRARSCSTPWTGFPRAAKSGAGLVDFPYVMLDPVEQVDEAEKWQKLWGELVGGQ